MALHPQMMKLQKMDNSSALLALKNPYSQTNLNGDMHDKFGSLEPWTKEYVRKFCRRWHAVTADRWRWAPPVLRGVVEARDCELGWGKVMKAWGRNNENVVEKKFAVLFNAGRSEEHPLPHSLGPAFPPSSLAPSFPTRLQRINPLRERHITNVSCTKQ